MCEGAAIYESDLARNAAEKADKSDLTNQEQMQRELTVTSRSETAANIALENAARHQRLSPTAIDREVELTRSQFRSPLSWTKVMYTNGLSPWILRGVIAANLRSQAWIENNIATALTSSTEQECAAYYDSHRTTFAQPMRLRARHIFFAAPPGSSPDLVERKRALAQGILDRLGRGEIFDNLAMESEDGSNKWTGGDLNFFAETRMPADFWAAVRDRHPGDPATLIRTG
jgi:parvulin-like peptidyl-prolyl isomerase